MNKYIWSVLLMCLVLGCERNNKIEQSESSEPYTSPMQKESLMSQQDWIVAFFIPPHDSENVLKVVFKDEMGMTNNFVYCMILFENKKTNEYKAVAPWIDKALIIQKNNMLSLNPFIVSKKEVTEESE